MRNIDGDAFLIINWSKKASVGADTIISLCATEKSGQIIFHVMITY